MLILILFFCGISVIACLGIIVYLILNHKQLSRLKHLAKLESLAITYQNQIKENEKQILMLQETINGMKNNSLLIADSELGADDKNYEPFVSSSILNLAINRKKRSAVLANILIDVDFENHYIPEFVELDMVTLFENLLDNAIEACTNVEHPHISCHCKITEQKNYQIIIANTKSKHIHPLDTNFSTTKKDNMNHGNGIRIINSIVQKYNGTIDFSDKGTFFITDIHLPV